MVNKAYLWITESGLLEKREWRGSSLYILGLDAWEDSSSVYCVTFVSVTYLNSSDHREIA